MKMGMKCYQQKTNKEIQKIYLITKEHKHYSNTFSANFVSSRFENVVIIFTCRNQMKLLVQINTYKKKN